MSFIQKIKTFFGIGLMDVKLEVPNKNFSADDEFIEGTLRITAKSDQTVKSIDFKFEENWTKGSGDEKTARTFDLGRLKLSETFDIKAGESREIGFKIPFDYEKSANDRMKEKGGALGAIGAASKFLSAKNQNFG